MALVLILGSHVAGSRVGGGVIHLALAVSPFAIDPVHVPTTLLGRHPGWGTPGGGPVDDATFAAMLEGVASNGLFALVDVVIANYFASAGQVAIAARVIDAVKAVNPRAIILVDPVMGDSPKGLYIDASIADSLIGELIPRADYIMPNLWELGHITGLATQSLPQVTYAATTLGRPVIVTSVPVGGEIGVMLVDGNQSWVVAHSRIDAVPKGTGDLLSALFVGHLLDRQMPHDAMAKAVGGVQALLDLANQWGSSELPIIAGANATWSAVSLPFCAM
jgi:pyridoxine kinase